MVTERSNYTTSDSTVTERSNCTTSDSPQ